MDDKDFLASLDEGLAKKRREPEASEAREPEASEAREQDEIQRLLDGKLPAAGDSGAPDPAEASAKAAAEPPEPTSVLEMLRQASEAVTPEDKPKPRPVEAPASPAPEAAGSAAREADDYDKAKAWLDGEGTTSAPGATQDRLRQTRKALRGRPDQEETAEAAGQAAPGEAAGGSEDPLEKLRLARERLRQTEAEKAPEPRRVPAQPREALKQVKDGWQPSKADRKAARKAKRGADRKKAKASAGQSRAGGSRADERVPEGWQGRVAMLACLLLAGAVVQVALMNRLGLAFALKDLAAGLCATFPVLFMMLAVRPHGFGRWTAVLFCYAAIVVVGSVAYVGALWVGRVGPFGDVALAARMTLLVGLYVICWGPLFLFTVWLFTRLDLWPQDRVGALAAGR